MTTSVDVLAVWVEMADSIANRRDECLGRGQFIQAEIYREMLAKHSRSMIAVGELIEAADELIKHTSGCEALLRVAQTETLINAKSALARVKGA